MTNTVDTTERLRTLQTSLTLLEAKWKRIITKDIETINQQIQNLIDQLEKSDG